MLRIPVETLPSVGPGSLPDARLSPNAPLDSFGGGAGSEAAFRAAQGLSQATSSFAMEAKNQDDLADVMGAVAKLHDAATDMQFNPQTGFLAKRGDQARDLQGPVREQYNKTVSDLSGTLRNDEQRLMFQKQANEKWAQVNGVLAAHTLQERQNYIGEQEGAIVNSSINAGAKAASIGDEKGLQDAVKTVESGLRASGALNGKPQETTDLTASIGVSKVYTEAIQSLLANGQDLSAKGLYDKYNGQMTENDKQRLAPHLLQGTTLGEAQRITSGLFQRAVDFTDASKPSGPTYASEKDLQDSVDAATKDASPLVKEKVEEMALKRYHFENLDQQQSQGNTFQKFADSMRKGSTLEDIQKNEDYLALPEKYKEALDQMSGNFAKSNSWFAKVNNPQITTEFWGMDQNEVASLSDYQMKAKAPSVTQATYQDMEKHWNAAKAKGVEFVIKKDDESYMRERIANASLGGLTPKEATGKLNADKAKALEDLSEEIRQKLTAAAGDNKNRLSQEQRRQVINDAVIEKVVGKPQSFIRKYGAVGGLLSGLSPAVGLASLAGYGFSRIGEAPPMTDSDRERLRANIMRMGGTPSDEKVNILRRAELLKASSQELDKLAGD